jgi:tRNA(adenine34) deaminase
MELALKEAAQAAALGEVPIGAVVVVENGNILASAGNRSVTYSDPTAHAEILALRKAGEMINNYRLIGTSIYVTLEPCAMCMGAMVHARVTNLFFAALDPKTGAVISQYEIGRDGKLNHNIKVEYGILAKESSELLSRFFIERRK